MNWNYRQTSGMDEFPPIVCDVQGDHREEIIWYDTDEIIILYNTDPLNVDSLPSPWNHLEYKLRYVNNNHCNAMYFDWTSLESMMDNTPPNAPTTLFSPSKTRNSITLSWTAPTIASDGDSASFYRIFRNESLVGSPITTAFFDTGLIENTPYTYKVFSVDDNNNQSSEAATDSFKTLPSSSDLYATISVSTPLPRGEKSIPVLLITSKKVVQVPTPLILKENDGSETNIVLEGPVNGQNFSGTLDLNDSIANGPAYFYLLEGSLVDTEGNLGNTITQGDSIYIDQTPPASPVSIQLIN